MKEIVFSPIRVIKPKLNKPPVKPKPALLPTPVPSPINGVRILIRVVLKEKELEEQSRQWRTVWMRGGVVEENEYYQIYGTGLLVHRQHPNDFNSSGEFTRDAPGAEPGERPDPARLRPGDAGDPPPLKTAA